MNARRSLPAPAVLGLSLFTLALVMSASSCARSEAKLAPAAADTTVVDTVAKAPSAQAAPRAAHRGHPHRHSGPVAVVEDIGPMNPGAGASPACIQLIAAEERLRVARERYECALRRFQVRTEDRQDRASDRHDSQTAPERGYPTDEYREFVAASMTVRTLQELCANR